MKTEVSNWWKQAHVDLEAAKDLYKAKNYTHCSFWCQQAAEKGLKALLLSRKDKLIKTHDLKFLGEKLNIPKDILEKCKKLSPVYIETRYPDANGEWRKYSLNEAKDDLKIAGDILLWIKRNVR
jgi:HEPN domain-containing protein